MNNIETEKYYTVIAEQPKTTTIVVEKQGPAGASGKSQLSVIELTDSISIPNNYILEPLHKYIVNRTTLTRLELPDSGGLEAGDIIIVVNTGSSPWRIVQKEFSQIQIGKYTTTLGITGYIEALSVGDRIQLEYLDNHKWLASVQGNVIFT